MSLLHEHSSPRLLRAVTIAVFGFWGLKVAMDAADSIAALPLILYRPIGLLRWMPNDAVDYLLLPVSILILKTIIIAGCVATVFGFRARLSAIVACTGLTLYLGLLRGFSGHVSHGDLGALYAAYLLALFPMADALLDANQRKRVNLSGVPVVAIVAVLCFTYSLAGLYRLMNGRLEIFTSGSIVFWALRNCYQYVNPLWGLGRRLLEEPVWAAWISAGFPVVTLLEVLAPLCLVSRRFRWLFLAVMVPFHLLAWVGMEIFFWEHLLLFILFFDYNAEKQKRQLS